MRDTPTLPRCSVYWHEETLVASQKIEPPNWQHAMRGAQELWMGRAMRNHPWRVHDAAQASVVVIAANFSLMCAPTGKRYMYALFGHWGNVVDHAPSMVLDAINGSASRVASTYLETSCPDPWMHYKPRTDAQPASHIRVLRMRDVAFHAMDVVTPPVLTGNRWLVDAAAGGMAATRWRQRPLLFFAGHTPKLHISRLRYELLRQLRGKPGVTALSSSINCTLMPLEICTSPERLSDGVSFRNYCHAACYAGAKPKSFYKTGRGFWPPSCVTKQPDLRTLCNVGRYAKLDWTAERAALNAMAVKLSSDEYGERVMQHRFCLAAPGDTLATPKMVEFILSAARGGCVPVLVLPDCVNCKRAKLSGLRASAVESRWRSLPEGWRGEGKSDFTAARLASLETHAAQLLPFSRWRLDYCAMAFILPESRTKSMADVLARLERVTAADAARKRASCAEAAPALSYSADDPVSAPGAATHLLSELCQVGTGSPAWPISAKLRPPTFDERCLLLPPTPPL